MFRFEFVSPSNVSPFFVLNFHFFIFLTISSSSNFPPHSPRFLFFFSPSPRPSPQRQPPPQRGQRHRPRVPPILEPRPGLAGGCIEPPTSHRGGGGTRPPIRGEFEEFSSSVGALPPQCSLPTPWANGVGSEQFECSQPLSQI